MTGAGWDVLSDLFVADRVILPDESLFLFIHVARHRPHIVGRGVARNARVIIIQVVA